MKHAMCILILLSVPLFSCAQLKYVIEDFEGFSNGTGSFKDNGIFTYGNISAQIESNASRLSYSGSRFVRVQKKDNLSYGGWGKGIGAYIQLTENTDYLNFFIYVSRENIDSGILKIELQEDDNNSHVYEKQSDDSWTYILQITEKNRWQLISIPINKFRDSNPGGDGKFNCNYKEGKLLTIVIDCNKSLRLKHESYSFDFICFSKGPLPTGPELFDAPAASDSSYCMLGAWSKEGNTANFTEIATNFETCFNSSSDKKLGVIHFFQPFAADGGREQNFLPSVERINKLIEQGYTPMITLEDHYVNVSANSKIEQPNLYSIIEGHFDLFLTRWAKEIKEVKGIVLLRILHEFNGDWYPWCIANNNKDPALLIKAYRHIHTIFTKQQVANVRFIWCPNSTSFPQESWNFALDAYPGDEYVDFVGLDIYNGAGKSAVWRSFRKEGMENYFLLTENYPGKPLLICEVASRENIPSERGFIQTKAEWIQEMSKAISSDMSKVKLLVWFNEKNSFRVDTSKEALNAYSVFVWKNSYFKSGVKYLKKLL